ncbi:hypothetical protein O3M35_001092 [Rhynocoris fuscipes]|uniref:CHK kinase-like domain-containing protein n=1 Tax=Rhynocoris fuscipes TaxID=488301 RepID=A0AAW1DP02_9HEMI
MEEKAWLETILHKDSYDKSISKVLNVSMISAVPEGNNYASEIYRATLDVILRSGRKSKVTLIVKKAHESEGKAKLLQDFSVFKGESRIYNDILTKFDQLMDDNQDNRDKLWCKMIGYKPYTALVFEDLKAQSFKMADRTKFLDKNHALLVFNSLGRFHGMGHVLIKQGLVSKEDFLPYFLTVDTPFVEKLIVGGLKGLSAVMEKDWSEEWKVVAKKLKTEEDAVKKLKALFTVPENCFQTICHGDCWTCNMMFKYCPYDENIPIAVKFLDFQGTHVSSHGFDLLYFLHTSVHPDIRRAQHKELIAEYHRSLKSTLTDYGMEADTPTLDQIWTELKRLQYHALIMSLTIQAITSADEKEAFVLENLDETQKKDAFNPAIFRSDRFKFSVQEELRKWAKDGRIY